MSDEPAKINKHLKCEYTQVCENMRHYGNMRFAQLTLHFALMAGLFTAVFLRDRDAPPIPCVVRLLLEFAGVAGSLAFLVMEYRAADYWKSLKDRAKKIETELNYRQHLDGPSPTQASASRSTEFMIVVSAGFWMIVLIEEFCRRLGRSS